MPRAAEVSCNVRKVHKLSGSEAMKRPLTIELDEEVYSYLELRAAIDDLRIKEGVEDLLSELVMTKKEGREIRFEGGKK